MGNTITYVHPGPMSKHLLPPTAIGGSTLAWVPIWAGIAANGWDLRLRSPGVATGLGGIGQLYVLA